MSKLGNQSTITKTRVGYDVETFKHIRRREAATGGPEAGLDIDEGESLYVARVR